jgi:DNA-binding LytR/AlgR family response regulator
MAPTATSTNRSEGIGEGNIAWCMCRWSTMSPWAKAAIKSKGKILSIDPREISTVEAEGHCVVVQHQAGTYFLREAISVVSEKLAPYGFVRIHPSTLVNPAFVEEIEHWSAGGYLLRIRGGKQCAVTRSYQKNIRSLARSSIGMSGFAPG